jgi:hypothetical protein
MATYFRDLLGQSESGGDYSAVNELGYSGKYQWGPDLLEDFNKAHDTSFSLDDLLNDPDLQETAQAWSEAKNLQYIEDRGLDEYYGKVVDGVVMTPTAMLAMAHLGGPSGMYEFVTTGGESNPQDINETSLRDYAAKFSPALPEGMGQTKLSFPEATGQDNENSPHGRDPSRKKALETAMSGFEMLQDSGPDFCPAGTFYEPLSGKCVTSSQLVNIQSSGQRPRPRPTDLGISALVK